MFVAMLPLLLSLATDAPGPDTTLVKFTGDVGFVSTSGNTSVQSLNFGNKFSVEKRDVTFSQTFNGVYGRSQGEVVTSNWRGGLRVDLRTSSKQISLFNLLNYERNVFAGIASRIADVSGLTLLALDRPRHRLNFDAGISFTRQRGATSAARDVDFLGGRAATHYALQLSSNAQLAQSVELLPNFRESDDFRVNTESTLTAPISRHIGIKLSYVIRYDGQPQQGFLTTDRLFTSGVQVAL